MTHQKCKQTHGFGYGSTSFLCLPQRKFVTEYKYELISPQGQTHHNRLPPSATYPVQNKEEVCSYMAIPSPRHYPQISVLIDKNAKISSRQGIKLDMAGIYAKTHLVKHHFEILNLCLFACFCGCVFWWVL